MLLRQSSCFQPISGIRRFCSVAVMMMVAPVWAQNNPLDLQEQRQRAEQTARERELRRQAPEVRLGNPLASDYVQTDTPQETTCFAINTIRLEGQQAVTFDFAQQYLMTYAGRCLGQQGVAVVVRRVNDLIIARGYITTRIGLPEQDLSTGTLRLVVIPGVVRAIRYADTESQFVNWHSALPIRPGDVLNLRAMEQGLEQFKRVSSQDVTMDIAPGEKAGESDLVIRARHSRRWHISTGIDNSGIDATGRYQASVNLVLDNPLWLNDILSVRYGRDTAGSSSRGTSTGGINYSVPWGDWLATVGWNQSTYRQTVPGSLMSFKSHGESSTASFALQRLLARGETWRTATELTISKQYSRSFIEDTELTNQRRNKTALELALLHRQFLGAAQLDLRLAYRHGVPWLGGMDDDPATHIDGTPTLRYALYTLDATLGLPWQAGGVTWLWDSTLHAQSTDDVLYGQEMLSIGGPFTVRGFDVDQTLAAERGVYWRNSLSLVSGRVIPYLGVDAGKVSGPSAANLPGHSLVGAFVGVRGAFSGVSWDANLGWPLQAPNTFNKGPVLSWQLRWSY